VIANHGYLVTVEVGINLLDRFDSTNLRRLNYLVVHNPSPMSVTYLKDAYYVAPYYSPIMLIGTENLTVLSNISTSAYGIRSIIFLNDGQTMFVAFGNNNSLVFLNRTRLVPINYTDTFIQPTSCNCPHEMLRMND